jgi:hypothetical protein
VDDVIKFHIDNNYYVDVKSLPKMQGCCVTFPANHAAKYAETTITYLLENTPWIIEKYELIHGQNLNVRKIPTTKSSIRILVLEDILLRTIARKLAQRLIIVDKTEGKNVFDALSLEMEGESLVLERDLLSKFRDLIMGKVNHNIENPELLEGYRLVLNCFENGGL